MPIRILPVLALAAFLSPDLAGFFGRWFSWIENPAAVTPMNGMIIDPDGLPLSENPDPVPPSEATDNGMAIDPDGR